VGSKEESEARLEDLWWVGFVFVFVVFARGVGGGSFEGPSAVQGDYSFFSFVCADGTRQARFESIDGSRAGAREP
jgi:hypothetical protein